MHVQGQELSGETKLSMLYLKLGNIIILMIV